MAEFERPARKTPQGQVDRINREADRERESARRNHIENPPHPPLVKLGAEAADSWPPGTAWLQDTSGS